MKPYYEHAGITIYHGDCRDVLPALDWGADAGISVVVTDPPYGISLENHGKPEYRTQRSWTIVGDDSPDAVAWVLAYLSGVPLVCFASPMRPWPGEWRQYLVWDKGPAVGGGGDPSRCWKQTWELIQVARTGVLNGSRDEAVLHFWSTPQESREHPAQKPVSLIAYLISKVSQDGSAILDPFMGSGTTLRAAKDLRRRAIGIEIEERYCEIAAKRLAQEVLL